MTTSDDLPIIPVGVRNAPFTLDLLAHDTPPTQFVREFTVNGIEAIEAYRDAVDPTYTGEVVWTIDPIFDADGKTKLACIDTGIGMSALEMPEHLNDLASSGKRQGLDRNYGIGAKVSSAMANPEGVIYASWQDGAGHMIELGRDDAGIWGMRQHRRPDGDVTAVIPLGDDAKPSELAELDHGTIVTFLGRSDDDDTTQPPRGERGTRWMRKQLNQRFYELPPWVTIRVREAKHGPGGPEFVFRAVRGQRHYLDQYTQAKGTVSIEGATVHWRILTDDHEHRAKLGDFWASTGHRACLFQGELFEMATAARGGYEKLKEFGIRFGYERVVLYIEPHTEVGAVTQDTVRTQVKIDGQALPWDRYAEQFEDRMPPELRAFQEEIAAGSTQRDHTAAIRERLAQIADLFDIPRYRPDPTGSVLSDEPNAGGTAGDKEQRTAEGKRRPKRTRGGTGGNVYALFDRDEGHRAAQIDAEALPEIKVDWVSQKDGTRTPPALEDRAANYDRRRNYLQINADFRGYRDVVKRWEARYRGVAGATAAIEEVAASWWQQGLEETIFGVLALRGSQYWDDRSVQEALSEVSLTAAAMQRYHLDAILKRELANTLGARRTAA